MNKRSRLLQEADRLVNGDRNRQYGDPNSDFLKTAKLWETYLNGTMERQQQQSTLDFNYVYIEPHDVAVLMMLLKISRLAWAPDKEDTWKDIAGYAACGWDCVAEADPLDADEEFQNDIAVEFEDDLPDPYDLLMRLIAAPTESLRKLRDS